MIDIFISYVEEDGDVVEPLARGLIQAGYSTWYYQKSSLPGVSYLLQITRAIAEAGCIVLVLSHDTLASYQVDKEIGFAHEHNRPFFPITRDLAWGELLQARPAWQLAIGTSVAIPIPKEGVEALVPRLCEGFQLLGIHLSRPASVLPASRDEGTVAPSTPAPPPRSVLMPGAITFDSLPTRTPFVGRAPMLSLLCGLYDAVAQGKGGRHAFIGGEAGFGKTRLAQEVGLYAWSHGGTFLEGNYLRDGTSPYGPWISTIRTGLRSVPRDRIATVFRTYGAELALLFPELAEQYGPSAAPVASEERRRRLFEGIVELLLAISAVSPIVLLINDLQWAPDLAPFLHLATRLGEARVLVIATYREAEFQTQPVLIRDWSDLNRTGLLTQIALSPFDQSETGDLIASHVGRSAGSILRAPVYERTHGNAYFLEEVLRSLVEKGSLRETETGWVVTGLDQIEIPETIRVVVHERVRRLGDTTYDVLSQASVLGSEFRLRVLREVSGRSEDELVDIIDRAIGARLLVDRSIQSDEIFAFSDDQIQEVLYEDLGPLRRRRTHVRAGLAIEALYAGRLDEQAGQLARHLSHSQDPAELARALGYTEAAARGDATIHAYSSSAQFWRQGVAIRRMLNPVDQAGLCDALLSLGDILPLAGQSRQVEEVASEAFDLAESLNDPLRAARASNAALWGIVRYGGSAAWRMPATRQWAARLDRYAPPDSSLRVMGSIILGQLEENWGRRFALLRLAHDLASKIGDLTTLVVAIGQTLLIPAPVKSQDDRRRLTEEALNLPYERASAQVHGALLRDGGRALLDWGERDRAEVLWQQHADLVARTRDPMVILQAQQIELVRATLDGKLERAVELRDELLAKADDLGMSVYGQEHAAETALRALLHLGRFDAALEQIAQFERAAGTGTPLVQARVTACLAAAGRHDEARLRLHQFLSDLKAGPEDGDTLLMILVHLLEAAVLLREPDAARILAARLAPVASLATAEWALTTVARQLGLAMLLCGDAARAYAYFEQALEVATRVRFRPEAALARLHLGEIAAARAARSIREEGLPVDDKICDQALDHLEHSRGEFQDMGMVAYAARAVAARQALLRSSITASAS